MLWETDKAAVIHLTCTGKFFSRFKFYEDFPEENICWFSSSEYIFRTKLGNLAVDIGIVPENVSFRTYARFMTMDKNEVAAIWADLIILEEFRQGQENF